MCRKHWAAGSVMAEDGTPVEIMARMEFEEAGSVGVAEVGREAAEDGVEEAAEDGVEAAEDGVEEAAEDGVEEAAAEELTTGTVMFT